MEDVVVVPVRLVELDTKGKTSDKYSGNWEKKLSTDKGIDNIFKMIYTRDRT